MAEEDKRTSQACKESKKKKKLNYWNTAKLHIQMYKYYHVQYTVLYRFTSYLSLCKSF